MVRSVTWVSDIILHDTIVTVSQAWNVFYSNIFEAQSDMLSAYPMACYQDS